VKNEFQLYERFKKFEWENYLDLNQTFVIDSTVHSDYFTHSHYAALKVKDALVDSFQEKYGKRPSVEKKIPISFSICISATIKSLYHWIAAEIHSINAVTKPNMEKRQSTKSSRQDY